VRIICNHMVDEKPTDERKGVSEDEHKGGQEDSPEDTPEDTPEDSYEGRYEEASEDTSADVSGDSYEVISEETHEDTPEEAPEEAPVDVTEDVDRITDEHHDKDLEGSILMIMKVWGAKGVTREILYDTIRGLKHDPMKNALTSLEKRDYVRIEWLDLDRFFAYITQKGLEYLEAIIREGEVMETALDEVNDQQGPGSLTHNEFQQ
jgi:hypothetical protein